MAKLNEKQINELSHLKDWGITIAEYLMSIDNNAISPPMFHQIIMDTFEKNNLRGPRLLINDINEMAFSMRMPAIIALNMILKEKFGKDLNDSSEKKIEKVKSIIKRGRIKNPDEYRVLLSRVEEIYVDDNNKEEVGAINQLLLKYDKEVMPER